MTRFHVQTETDLGDLPVMWAQLEQLQQQKIEADARYDKDPTLLSRRRFDEAKVSGTRAYIRASSLLAVAEDNQLVFEEVLQKVGITPYAPWSLIRPAFEAAFHALWILDPESDHERRRRGLQEELADQRERKNWIEAVQATGMTNSEMDAKIMDRNTEVLAKYEAEAKHFNRRVSGMNRLPNLVDELPQLRSISNLDPIVGRWLAATWRQLSGLQHGHMYAMLLASEATQRIKIPGGVSVVITASDDVLITSAKMSAALQALALRRYIDLTITQRLTR